MPILMALAQAIQFLNCAALRASRSTLWPPISA